LLVLRLSLSLPVQQMDADENVHCWCCSKPQQPDSCSTSKAHFYQHPMLINNIMLAVSKGLSPMHVSSVNSQGAQCINGRCGMLHKLYACSAGCVLALFVTAPPHTPHQPAHHLLAALDLFGRLAMQNSVC
jgi:hypothetical protein